jgi:hypothetical protein
MRLLTILFFLLLESYAVQPLRAWARKLRLPARSALWAAYALLLLFTFACVLIPLWAPRGSWLRNYYGFYLVWVVSYTLFLLIRIAAAVLEDLRRLWLFFRHRRSSDFQQGQPIPRSEFLAKSGIVLAALPAFAIGRSVWQGAHDFQVNRRQIWLPHLPAAWDGLRIAQISDFHAGSFWDRLAVEGGISLLNNQQADLILFTGDLVNSLTSEAAPYAELLRRVRAPLGVYSSLGNHDFPDYAPWLDEAGRAENFRQMIAFHASVGWRLLRNEHVLLREGSEALALAGVDNWSAKGGFPRHGKLAQALAGSEEAAVRILLSHDPTHWRAEVLQAPHRVDLMLAGHTHGMQLGIETAHFRWSPVQYYYPEWADLYREGGQHLYVNRGFGYIGLPGRVGILPEIALLELKRGEGPAA